MGAPQPCSSVCRWWLVAVLSVTWGPSGAMGETWGAAQLLGARGFPKQTRLGGCER